MSRFSLGRYICGKQGRPLNLFVTAGQVSDCIDARALLSSRPDVNWLLGDRGYDADGFRKALKDKGVCSCAPGRLVPDFSGIRRTWPPSNSFEKRFCLFLPPCRLIQRVTVRQLFQQETHQLVLS